MLKLTDQVLKVKNLNVKLEGEEIIKELSFQVNKGDVLTILGPNGAGKTVLLRTLLGFLPYRGEIHWMEGIKIGYVPQRLPFIKDIPLSVKEFFKVKGIKEKKAKEILGLIGLKDDFLNKKMGDLSSGQFQRILVAWSLSSDPQVLLFDEPTTGIDMGGEETIYGLLAKLKKEKDLTILLVTHDLSVVYKFSDYVICLNKCPICQGIPKEVLTPEILRNLYAQEVKFYEHHKH